MGPNVTFRPIGQRRESYALRGWFGVNFLLNGHRPLVILSRSEESPGEAASDDATVRR